MLTNSPFEFFGDCVGLVLIVMFSVGVTADLAIVVSYIRGWLRG